MHPICQVGYWGHGVTCTVCLALLVPPWPNASVDTHQVAGPPLAIERSANQPLPLRCMFFEPLPELFE
jgi:hypothetical protein